MLLLRSTSLAATHEIAAALARHVRVGDVVVLAGEMGSGKTAFAQGFGAYAGAAVFARQFGADDPGHGVVPVGGSLLVAFFFFTLHADRSRFATYASALSAFVGMFLAWTFLSAAVITLAHGAAWLARKLHPTSADA